MEPMRTAMGLMCTVEMDEGNDGTGRSVMRTAWDLVESVSAYAVSRRNGDQTCDCAARRVGAVKDNLPAADEKMYRSAYVNDHLICFRVCQVNSTPTA